MSEEMKDETISIPARGSFSVASLLPDLRYLRELKWDYKKWAPSPALIEKKGGSSVQYVGQRFDSKYFDLVEDGWTHDHCAICSTVLSENNEEGETEGYASNNEWVCSTCYKCLIEPPNLEEALKGLMIT